MEKLSQLGCARRVHPADAAYPLGQRRDFKVGYSIWRFLMNTLVFRNRMLWIFLLFVSADGLAEIEEKGTRISERKTFSERIVSAPGKTLYVDRTQADLIISGGEQT